MASYPGAVFSKTTHVAGDIVQPADVNNVEDEIVALEQDLVNGALRVNLTPSTDVSKNIGSASFRWQSFYSSALQALDVASRSNYVTVTAAITGSAPTIAATGASDTNVGLNINAKGTTNINFGNGVGQPWAQITGPATGAANFCQLTGELTGVFPGIVAAGTDTNITLDIFCKGAATVVAGTTAASWVIMQGDAAGVNQVLLTGKATGLTPSIASTGSDTNVGLIINTKGTGAITLQTGGLNGLLVNNTGTVQLGTNSGQLLPPSDIGAQLGAATVGWSKVYLRGTSGVIRFDDTTIMGITLKKGSGAGNYTTTSTTYVDVDATNLAFTVTVPTGWKALVSWSGAAFQSTAIAIVRLALADGTTTLVETEIEGPAAASATPFNLQWVFAGDGASHTFKPRFLTSNAADAAGIVNSSATELPVMTVTLMPSN